MLKSAKWNVFLAFLLLAAAELTAADAPMGSGHLIGELQGAWAQVNGEGLVLVEPDRLVIKEGEVLRAVAVLSTRGYEVTVRDMGLQEVWRIRQRTEGLEITQTEGAALYTKLPSAPAVLDLTPLVLGRQRSVPAERVQEIAQELVRRVDEDQAVRTVAARRKDRKEVDSQNRAYLVQVLQDVGWIDAARFGLAAARAAAVLTKHTNDPRLLQAVLPLVEKDMPGNGISGELYSVMYDGLRLTLGFKQRFGTQVDEDQAGPFVAPLENPAMVDEYRRALGLSPLQEYLALASETLFAGKPLRIRVE